MFGRLPVIDALAAEKPGALWISALFRLPTNVETYQAYEVITYLLIDTAIG